MATSTTAAPATATQHGVGYALKRLGRGVVYLLTLVFGIMFTLPFLWTLSSSLKPPWELYLFPPSFFPKLWSPGNFLEIWRVVPFAQWTLNSVFVAVLNVGAEVVAASLVAYGFARFHFQGRNVLFLLLLSTMMLPAYVTIIPTFLMFKSVGWVDTLMPLVVPPFFGGGAFDIFLLRQFFMTIPLEYDEAAYLDGANSLTILRKVILPLSKPAISTVAIFGFIGSWSNFLAPLIFLNTKTKFTLPLGLTWFRVVPLENAGIPRDHLLMAASVTVTLPAVILFFSAQRYFIAGIVMSGIKG
jgi:multiple sugar transport system permease protein